MKKYIVCWVKEKKINIGQTPIIRRRDHYRVFVDEDVTKKNKKAAIKFYAKILNKKSTYSANLCEILSSTDY